MRYYILSLMLLLLVACGGDRTLVVTNSSSVDRVGEILEVEIEDADEYAVYTTDGEAVQCQTTYKGRLIFPVTVAANSTSSYILRRGGERVAIDTIATGKVYPVWFDDFAWENDKIGFRTYSKRMVERGDTLYGYDIFTKRSDKPVLDFLYGFHFDEKHQAALKILRKEDPELALKLAYSTSYHLDHGLGMDYYAVGPTLGSGTAALLSGGEIQYPFYYDTCELLDAGGLRLTFRLTFAPVEFEGEMVQEVRTITLDKGTHFNHIEVEYKNLSKPVDIAIGIVMHDDGATSIREDGFIAYAEPLYMYLCQTYNAVIYPDEVSNRVQYFEKPIGAAQGHILSEGRYTPGQSLTYYMGAGWNRWGFEKPQDWFDYVTEEAKAIKTPLTYIY